MKKLIAIALCAAMLASMFCVNVFSDTTATNIAANANVSVSYVDTAKTETPPTGGGIEKLNDGVVNGNNQSTYWEVEPGSIAVSFKFDKTYVIDRIYLVTENWYDHGATKPMHSQKLHFEAKVNDAWTPITAVFNDVDTAGVENIDVTNNIVPVDIVLDDYAVTDEIRLVFDECTRAYFNAKEVMVYGTEYDAANPPAVKPEATIGTTDYATLAEALTAAQAGDTVTLQKNITTDATVVIDKAITLDGNGKTITSEGVDALKIAGDSLNVTIKNLNVVGAKKGLVLAACTSADVKSTVTITDTKITSNGGYGVEVLAFWAVNLDKVEIDGSTGGFICGTDNGANTITVTNSKINGRGSYGFYMVQKSTGTITDSTITTTAKTSGTSYPNSAIQIKTSAADTGSTLTLNNVTASGAGYTVAVNPFNKIYINGGTYTMVSGEGYVNADAVINVGNADAYCKITAGTFTSVKNCAARVYTTNSDSAPNKADTNPSVFDIEGGTFILNNASSTGSAIRAGTGAGYGTVNISGGHFITNGKGAVVNTANAKGVINITGGIFENNGENEIKVVDNSGNAAVAVVEFPEGVKKVEFKNGAFAPVVDTPDTPDVPGGDTTTVPGGDTTTVPGGDTTTAPGGDTTTEPTNNDTTTEAPTDPAEKPVETTKKPDEPKKKGCGGFALAAQIVTILGAAVTVVIVKKK